VIEIDADCEALPERSRARAETLYWPATPGTFADHVQLRTDAFVQARRAGTVVAAAPEDGVKVTATLRTPDPASDAVPSIVDGVVTDSCVPPAVVMRAEGEVRSTAGRVGGAAGSGRPGVVETGGTAAAGFGREVADAAAAAAVVARCGTAMALPAPARPGPRGLGTRPKFPMTKYTTRAAAAKAAAA
jgi:hypothetical protein